MQFVFTINKDIALTLWASFCLNEHDTKRHIFWNFLFTDHLQILLLILSEWGGDRNSLHLVLEAKFGDHSLLSFRKNKFLVWICFYFGLFWGLHFCGSLLLRMFFNPFLTSVSILYPLKTPENRILFEAFGRYKMGTLARNWLNNIWSARVELAVNIIERET